jgi:hypothetical protein
VNTPAKWWRKCKRRRGGVYGVRTRKHRQSMRREWGYIGESVSFYLRQKDHEGTGRYGHAAKFWSDLDPVFHRIIPLPWWLCWKWVLRPLETLVILCTWPRYNVSKNRWNPRRVSLYTQQAQRAARDTGGLAYRAGVRVAVFGRRTLQFAGTVLILIGVAMSLKEYVG